MRSNAAYRLTDEHLVLRRTGLGALVPATAGHEPVHCFASTAFLERDGMLAYHEAHHPQDS